MIKKGGTESSVKRIKPKSQTMRDMPLIIFVKTRHIDQHCEKPIQNGCYECEKPFLKRKPPKFKSIPLHFAIDFHFE